LWGGAAGASETSVNTDHNKHCHILEDDELNLLSSMKFVV